jgi:hypothetical protein
MKTKWNERRVDVTATKRRKQKQKEALCLEDAGVAFVVENAAPHPSVVPTPLPSILLLLLLPPL